MIRAFKCLTKANTVASVQNAASNFGASSLSAKKEKAVVSGHLLEGVNLRIPASKYVTQVGDLVRIWKSESYQGGHRLSHTQYAQAWMVLGAARPTNKRGVSWYRLISFVPPKIANPGADTGHVCSLQEIKFCLKGSWLTTTTTTTTTTNNNNNNNNNHLWSQRITQPHANIRKCTKKTTWHPSKLCAHSNLVTPQVLQKCHHRAARKGGCLKGKASVKLSKSHGKIYSRFW